MRRHLALAGLLLTGTTVAGFQTADAGRARRVSQFPDARLNVEFNATDGDAGLQVFLTRRLARVHHHEPLGQRIPDLEAGELNEQFGLTELFSESSEPPFDEFPFQEFKQLFPEGTYPFSGASIEGDRLRSRFRLTHDVPAGPVITSPVEDSTVAPDDLVVTWLPDASDPDVDVVAYQVLVVADHPFVGNPTRVLYVMLPADGDAAPRARRVPLAGDLQDRGARHRRRRQPDVDRGRLRRRVATTTSMTL